MFKYNIGIPEWTLDPSTGPVHIPIPESNCISPLHLIWPAENGTCSCALSSQDMAQFTDCARACGSDYDVTIVENEAVIFKYSNSVESFLVHFFCEANPCIPRDICYTTSLIASHRIIHCKFFKLKYTISIINALFL